MAQVEEHIRITENTVASTDTFVQVIYLDGVAHGYCRNEINAKFHIEDLADDLEKELKEPNTRILRQNIGDNEIHISRQRLGALFDGSVKLKHTLSYRPVSKYFRIKQTKTISD